MNIVSTDNSLKLYRINKYFTKENICIKFSLKCSYLYLKTIERDIINNYQIL